MTQTKTQIKQNAQDELMSAMQIAFANKQHSDELVAEISRQMERVEKLFGYKPGSWARSC